MSRRAIKFAAGDPWPAYIEPYLLISLTGQNLVHLTKVYPDEHNALCGRVNRAGTYDRGIEATEEFTRSLCGDCAALAKVSA
jgi:hypothetical protein